MRIFGFDITRQKSAVAPVSWPPVGWNAPNGWPNPTWTVREPFTGAWQRNSELRLETVLAYSAVFACVTLIASDIAKLPLRLMAKDSNDIWTEIFNPAFSPVLRKPNHYQNRIKFIESWLISKLIQGNAYVLKERDNRGIVVALYVLDPWRTTIRIAPDGQVFYSVAADNLAGITESNINIPSEEIIHDVMVAFFHPLCGVSPITACGLAAAQGLSIQRQSTMFFEQGANPSGILTAPGPIDDDKAARYRQRWQDNYSGVNAGKVAVLGNGLKFEKVAQNAVDSQLIDQLKWTAETVCSVFHVPPYMIGVGPAPNYNNVESLIQQYYNQCLQALIESLELCLDEGLGLGAPPNMALGTEFDLEELLRMDNVTKIKTAIDGIKGGLMSPNEARAKFGMRPVDGGDDCYLQQQNFSLSALAKRDAQDDPFAKSAPGGTAPPQDNQPPDGTDGTADGADGAANASSGRDIADDILARAKRYALGA